MSEKEKKVLSELRGLSEAFFFGFNVTDDKSKQLVSHGVIFTSVVKGGSESIGLMTEDSDPRVKQLVEYVYSNWYKDKFEELQKKFEKVSALYPQAKDTIARCEKIIEEDRKWLEELKTKAANE